MGQLLGAHTGTALGDGRATIELAESRAAAIGAIDVHNDGHELYVGHGVPAKWALPYLVSGLGASGCAGCAHGRVSSSA